MPVFHAATSLRQTRSFYRSKTGIGTLTLHNQKRTWSDSEQSPYEERQRERPRHDYDMTLVFLPESQQGFHMLVATIRQRELFGRAVSSLSRLEVNRVLPADALVLMS